MKEREFGRWLEAVLKEHGWLWKHDETAIRQSGKWSTPLRGHRGFPDYFAIRDRRVVAAEIKSDTGRLRPEQVIWLDALRALGHIEVYVWRPADKEEILEVLQ